MKKYNLATLVITVIASALWFTACQDEDIDGIRPTTYNQGTSGKPGPGGTVSIGNGLYGTSKVDWTKEWWKYVMKFDCANNPLNQSGVSTAPRQIGQVVYLVPGAAFSTTSFEMSKNQTLLVPVINILSEYPCTASGKPKRGETIEHFLKSKADVAIDQAANIKVDFDFERIEITDKNRITTNLFYFKGNKELARCIDPCVTGQIQSAVSDGYWLFFENLTPGKHILTIHAEILATGEVVDVTFKILVL